MNIEIYTDGASRGNPGPGGYGILMELVGSDYKKTFNEGFRITTNNRMELLAVIVALEKVKNNNASITVFSDSKYVCDAVNKNWILGWKKKNFKNVKNLDLWKRFLIIYEKRKVKFVWVKGHSDNEKNNLVDALAVEAATRKELKIDVGYERNL